MASEVKQDFLQKTASSYREIEDNIEKLVLYSKIATTFKYDTIADKLEEMTLELNDIMSQNKNIKNLGSKVYDLDDFNLSNEMGNYKNIGVNLSNCKLNTKGKNIPEKLQNLKNEPTCNINCVDDNTQLFELVFTDELLTKEGKKFYKKHDKLVKENKLVLINNTKNTIDSENELDSDEEYEDISDEDLDEEEDDEDEDEDEEDEDEEDEDEDEEDEDEDEDEWKDVSESEEEVVIKKKKKQKKCMIELDSD